ncbi:MAG: hypothetical protein QUS14_05625, partial [Pyrinomonadaceae bacterium]|nr:hypothetical protein [Pyrinomonadaceae bacterium]
CSGSARGLGVGYAVPAGGNLVCTYQAVLEDTADRTNTATARLQNFNYNSAGDPTPGGTTDFNGSAPVSFASATVNVVGFDTVNVTDDIAGNLGTTSDDITWNYPDTYTCGVTTNRQNTATITETGQSDTESVTYNCYELQVAKTAAASFTRVWDWTINKSADVSNLTLAVGQSFAVNYDVFVAPHSTSSNFLATGEINVTNPHPSSAAEVTVTDVAAGGYPGVVSCPSTAVPAGGSMTCTYTATLPNDTDRLNTATVQHGTFATYTADALVDFSGPTTETDETVNVNDTLKGFLGTQTGPIHGQNTYEYPLTIGPFAQCGTYQVPNTASFVTNDTGTTGSDGHNVTVNVPCGTILVRKVVLSPNAADTPDDFSYTFNGGSPITFNANGTSPTTHVVNPGTYTIAEPVTNGFVASYSGDCNAQGQITAMGGETKTCTITNVYLTGFVTSSSLCTFDVDNDDSNGNQFRLLLTPDVQLGYGIYKLNASNPGQYYY